MSTKFLPCGPNSQELRTIAKSGVAASATASSPASLVRPYAPIAFVGLDSV